MTYSLDLSISNPEQLSNAVNRAREHNITLPSFAQMIDPGKIPQSTKAQLAAIDLWDLHPANLFRIGWHNQPVTSGGGFGPVNCIEIPKELVGTPARILVMLGKWFPTGAHKVGAAYGCLCPALVTGRFDPVHHKAVWPSTGNYCRGGAYDSNLLGCESIAILPEGMSRERFEWLDKVAGDTIRTPGSESNVKEIFDKCNELERSGQDLVIFNQFDQFGNYIWHYEVTGRAIQEMLQTNLDSGQDYRGIVLATGSGGTLACGDYLKQLYPSSKIAACEALQCPTLLHAGYGSHRIEGIGDKHIPWIHNAANTDMVIAMDDEAVMSVMRLFNETSGHELLAEKGVDTDTLEALNQFGISGISNILCAAKMAKYYEMTESDVIVTIATDSMEMYGSRMEELLAEHGHYSHTDAAVDYGRYILGNHTDNMQELDYYQKKRIHNLKYYTWVEQQGKDPAELDAQWYDRDYWTDKQGLTGQLDALINEFNARVAEPSAKH